MTAAISGCGKAISIIRQFQLSGRPLEQRGPDNRGCTVMKFMHVCIAQWIDCISHTLQVGMFESDRVETRREGGAVGSSWPSS